MANQARLEQLYGAIPGRSSGSNLSGALQAMLLYYLQSQKEKEETAWERGVTERQFDLQEASAEREQTRLQEALRSAQEERGYRKTAEERAAAGETRAQELHTASMASEAEQLAAATEQRKGAAEERSLRAATREDTIARSRAEAESAQLRAQAEREAQAGAVWTIGVPEDSPQARRAHQAFDELYTKRYNEVMASKGYMAGGSGAFNTADFQVPPEQTREVAFDAFRTMRSSVIVAPGTPSEQVWSSVAAVVGPRPPDTDPEGRADYDRRMSEAVTDVFYNNHMEYESDTNDVVGTGFGTMGNVSSDTRYRQALALQDYVQNLDPTGEGKKTVDSFADRTARDVWVEMDEELGAADISEMSPGMAAFAQVHSLSAPDSLLSAINTRELKRAYDAAVVSPSNFSQALEGKLDTGVPLIDGAGEAAALKVSQALSDPSTYQVARNIAIFHMTHTQGREAPPGMFSFNRDGSITVADDRFEQLAEQAIQQYIQTALAPEMWRWVLQKAMSRVRHNLSKNEEAPAPSWMY